MKIQSIDDILCDLDFEHYGIEKADNITTLNICVQIQRNQILQAQIDIAAESVSLLSQQLAIIKGEC
jgi:hypothetical protein